MQKCVVCGSNNVPLWLGGSIGTLYQCTSCNYIGPTVVEPVEAVSKDIIYAGVNLMQGGPFWSETGIGNRSLLET